MRVLMVLLLASCIPDPYLLEEPSPRITDLTNNNNYYYYTNERYVNSNDILVIREKEDEDDESLAETTGKTVGVVGTIMFILRVLPNKIGDKLFDLVWGLCLWPFKWGWQRLTKAQRKDDV